MAHPQYKKAFCCFGIVIGTTVGIAILTTTPIACLVLGIGGLSYKIGHDVHKRYKHNREMERMRRPPSPLSYGTYGNLQ